MKKLFAVLGILLFSMVPRLVLAVGAECHSIGGSCIETSLCDMQRISDPSITSQPSDCVHPAVPETANDTCCVMAKQRGSECLSLGGRCESESLCQITMLSIPGTTNLSSDCVDASEPDTLQDTCCVLPDNYECEVQNQGHCASNGATGEADIGKLGCRGTETCWKLPTAVPTESTGSGKTAGGGVTSPPGTLFAAIEGINKGTITCIQTGNCTVDDIVYAGVGFAKFLMGLSGALFFIIFIYGGAMYLMSFGEKSRVEKGKKAIIGAAIGIVIVAGAWTIVKYVVGGITGQAVSSGAAGSAKPPCEAQGEGWSCQTFVGETSAAAKADCEQSNLCKIGYCPNTPVNVLCAKKK